ncbi:MAG: hypothetical protein M1826_007439 [Phylliscum demangeonii]|nr:MAG: hypothetical protein M1826_007439 [Phylliscum demangeonii]
MNHFRKMLRTARAAGLTMLPQYREQTDDWLPTLGRRSPLGRVCLATRRTMACGVQSDLERIERRRYLADQAMEYHNYWDSTSDEELLALVPARIAGVGHAKRARKVYVMTMYPDINPDYITGKLPANASPEVIEARESTRQLNNQLTEGRALLELRDAFGEGVFLLYPPNCRVPRPTPDTVIPELGKQPRRVD